MTASWVAIDFETATQSRASACAIGIVTVEDGVVVAEREILIQPPGNEYDGFNIAIHGITPEDTADAPTFAEVWPEIERAIDGRLVLAHNAGFDLSVLRHAFEELTAAECTINYGCTLVLGRRHWKGLPSYSLPLLCDAVGVNLVDHHDALSDARACSGLASRLLDELGVSSIGEAAAELRVSLGQVGAKDIRCLAADIRAPMPQPNVDADPDHPFFGRCVSFTGALLQWTRAEAASLVAARGGIPSKGVTKKTNYLVTGDQDPAVLRGKPMSGKAAKAALYASGGQEIEVLTELDFTRLLLG